VSGGGAARNPSVEGKMSSTTGDDEGDPGNKVNQVRTGVVGGGVKSHREKKSEGQCDASDCRDSAPESEQSSNSNCDFTEGDNDAERSCELQEVPNEAPDGAHASGGNQLGLDRRRARRVEEIWIGKFLKSGESKGESEEEPER
jgi:hypothetical protein